MRIAIVSDIHDNLWNLAAAVNAIQDADALICCGDLCSPFVIDELSKFPRDVHIVFGNNDADLYRITSKAAKKPNCHLHGELFQQEFDGKRFAVNHFDYLAK
ncbi:MAG: metallophosphatase family protein, partial [Acidobacteriota bacterium]|nr:metallophosphatase family protein [Acidobacteriota bacterium]